MNDLALFDQKGSGLEVISIDVEEKETYGRDLARTSLVDKPLPGTALTLRGMLRAARWKASAPIQKRHYAARNLVKHYDHEIENDEVLDRLFIPSQPTQGPNRSVMSFSTQTP